MKHQYTIHLDRNLVIEIFTGPVTVKDLRGMSTEVQADPRYRTGMHSIADFRAAEVQISFEEMMKYVDLLARYAIGRQAIVASGPLQYGLGRMYELMTEESPATSIVRIFTNFEDAMHWVEGGQSSRHRAQK